MGAYKNQVLTIVVTLISLSAVFCNIQPTLVINSVITGKKTPIGDCQACKIFIESFKSGLERTAGGKYEGGDAAWDEEKLKKLYKRSEMRLADIQKDICKETNKYLIDCHQIAGKAEYFIEEWWAQDPDESEDLYTYICINSVKVCCPEHHYGRDCKPCLGDHNRLCSGNGKCRGDGTRKGNGTCLCDPGYTGKHCDECVSEYYLAYSDDNKMLCSPCHMSCMGGCRAGSNKDCSACKKGFSFDSDEGCLDINECDDIGRCKKDEFCMNSLGSYICTKCDKACNGCHGDGPDLCQKCAKEYSKKGEFCVADRDDDLDSSEAMTMTRYITYVGLLLATAILLPRSAPLGTLVGAMVLAYIVGAEYYCMINGHMGLINLKEFNFIEVFHK